MKKGKIVIPPQLGYIEMNEANLLDFIHKLHTHTWRAKSKKNPGGDAQVVKYLGVDTAIALRFPLPEF